jgi:hypothetical protein
MFKAEDILIRLQNGEDVGAIANEMTEALNAANDQFQKEQETRAKEEETKARNANKAAAMQEILDKTYAFLIEFYCEDDKDLDAVEQLFEELDAATAIEMIDEAMDCVAELVKIEQALGKLVLPAAPKEKKTSKISKDASADVVINNFLASLDLK